MIADFECKYCGAPSHVDPSDQSPPADYCHPVDHGEVIPDHVYAALAALPPIDWT